MRSRRKRRENLCAEWLSCTATISIPAPVSVVFLPGGEIAVSSPTGEHLITVYDLAGNVVRDFGDREEIADQAEINSQVNFGHLAADGAGNTYFAFDYLPEPTVRKFDHAGLSGHGDFPHDAGISSPRRRRPAKPSRARKPVAPSLHRIISAIGVDPQTQDIWLAIGTLLMHFDKEGQRIASFRTFTPGGARLEPSMILVEPDRLLIGSDPQGTYEFPKPAKLPQ